MMMIITLGFSCNIDERVAAKSRDFNPSTSRILCPISAIRGSDLLFWSQIFARRESKCGKLRSKRMQSNCWPESNCRNVKLAKWIRQAKLKAKTTTTKQAERAQKTIICKTQSQKWIQLNRNNTILSSSSLLLVTQVECVDRNRNGKHHHSNFGVLISTPTIIIIMAAISPIARERPDGSSRSVASSFWFEV